jgi:Anti-sigma-K factor rskA, C-terminal
MLAVPADRLPAALADLDPGNRALLDLSLRRGVSDAEIGELLRKQPDEVARGRDAVLGLLADALEVDGHDRRDRVRRAIAALPDDAWRPPSRGEPPPPPPRGEEDYDDEDDKDDEEEAVPVRERERPAPPPPDEVLFFEPEERRPRRGRLLALLGLVAAIGVLIALLVGGGDDDGDNPAPDRADRRQPANPPPERGRSARLAPLGGAPGSGRLSVAGDGKLVVSLRGLPEPDGSYQAWLYNSVADAVQLGTFRAGSGRLAVRLPARAARYRFVDVSLEPADSNRNHSGQSIMRTRLTRVLKR